MEAAEAEARTSALRCVAGGAAAAMAGMRQARAARSTETIRVPAVWREAMVHSAA